MAKSLNFGGSAIELTTDGLPSGLRWVGGWKGEVRRRARDHGPGSCIKNELSLNPSGNKLYYTACFLPVILKYSRIRLDCIKVFKLKLVFYQISQRVDGVTTSLGGALLASSIF